MSYFSLFLLLFGFLTGLEALEKKVLFITVPKAGTHLLRKGVELISGHKMKWIGQRQFASPNLEETILKAKQKYFLAHLFSDSEQVPLLDPNLITKVLLIRDPRDVMVSFQNHLLNKKGWPFSPTKNRKMFFSLSTEEQLTLAIQYPPFGPGDALPIAANWCQNPTFTILRFEDLVGEKGGGSDAAQLAALTKLANCMEISLPSERLDEIKNSLFGGTWTFHKGQIGSWHMAFSHQNRALFKSLFGQVTIDLGYEKDLNW